jgi:hypothetical protein
VYANAGSDLVVRFVAFSRSIRGIRTLLRPDRGQVLSRISPNWTKFWYPGSPPVGVRRRARKLGIYAVEHATPGFLGSLALRVTQGSVSNPYERVRRLSHYDPDSR